MKKQQGLTLIELLIALALGIIFIGGSVQIFLASRVTNALNEDLIRIQDNARIALDLMSRDIQMAGYNGEANAAKLDFFETGPCGGFSACTNNNAGAGIASDRIAVIFDPRPDDGTEVDCTGNPLAADEDVAHIYFINTNGGTGVNSLVCQGYSVTNGTMLGVAQPIVDGIDAMHILYGERNGDSVTRYVNAAEVTNWAAVAGVRISLLVSNGNGIGSADTRLRSYSLLDSNTINYGDTLIRRIYSTTVRLNNAEDEL